MSDTATVDITARLEAMKQGRNPDEQGPDVHMSDEPPPRYYRPLGDAADEYINWASNPQDRVDTGIDPFDKAMRGIAPGEMCIVQGYAHSGKTVFITQMILANADIPVVLFTPDETRVMILVKLASIVHKISAEDLETLIARGDEEAKAMVREVAAKHFPKLAVFDDSLPTSAMSHAMRELEQQWGERPRLAFYDYAKLLPEGEDMVQKLMTLKSWGKQENVPFVVLHQSSRSKGADGAKVTIDSGEYGGEQQATFVVGVRRKKMAAMAAIAEIEQKMATGSARNSDALDAQLLEAHDDLRRHKNTVTFNMVKNKRPPGQLVDDIDFRIDPEHGTITQLDGGFGEPIRPIEDEPFDGMEEAF